MTNTFSLITVRSTSPIEAYTCYAGTGRKRDSLTMGYIVKNYLLLLSSLSASLGPRQARFSTSRSNKKTFPLGYFEDIYSQKIYYLEGKKGSKYLTLIELEKDNDRYNLSDIVVYQNKSFQIEAAQFYPWLRDVTSQLAQACGLDLPI